MPVTQYKKVEKELADRIGSWLRRIWSSLGNFFRHVMVKGRQRFTVMLIPHSEKKIFNFQISFFTLIFITVTLGIVLVGFFLLATNFTYINRQNIQLMAERDADYKTLTSLKDEIATIRTTMKRFKISIDNVVAASQSLEPASSAGSGIVASSFLSPEDPAAGSDTNKDLSDLKSLISLLNDSSYQLDQMNKTLSEFKDLMANTPTYWPLKGTYGSITTRFVWTINPFTHVGYLHTGVDIAWNQGTPVVATADGKVIQWSSTDELGFNVTIQHKYGFYTRYAHLERQPLVKTGDIVHRGDLIGYLGNTGLSTGPHLHYEVRLGSAYLDPMTFLSITPENAPIALGVRSSD